MYKIVVVAVTLAALVAIQPTHAAATEVHAPSNLERGHSWTSNTARLTMQTDGNLVVYDEFDNPLWNSETVNKGWRASFQTDGNFVVYKASGAPVWWTGTDGHPGSRLVVQDDGNIVIYDGSQAIWQSHTAHKLKVSKESNAL